MKLNALLLVSALGLGAVNAEKLNPRHLAKRQAPGVTTSPTTVPTTPTTTPAQQSPNVPTMPATTPAGTPTPAPAAPATTAVAGVVPPAAPVVTTPAAAVGTTIPPLASITLGMPTRASLAAATTHTPGATPPIKGAPVLPSPAPSAFVLTSWPKQDHIPPTDSPEVKEWMKELDGYHIPDLSLTVNGSCDLSPAQKADAPNRGWWTCGGHTRATDIVACPTKLDWGVSFDDGPSGYSKYLLNYLDQKKLSATFFVVGSRVIERPYHVIEEYMSGHDISVHTWSHSPLTTLTNEQIVAELGWTRKAIKTFIGVTPTTMRPPYGDIDDRVRAISLAMGMVPIMWTRSPSGDQFDTNDWKVAGGIVPGDKSFESFVEILGNATVIDTGFIVLQHDLYEISVDLAVGYTLDAALSHNPAFKLKSIGECSGIPTGNLYLETNANSTFPYHNSTAIDVSGDGKIDVQSGDGGKTVPGTVTADDNKSAGFANAVPFSLLGAGLAALGLML